MPLSQWKHQGIIQLNDLKFLFIPKGEELFIGHCYVDGVICERKDFDNNYSMIQTINEGLDKELITIFLDELDSPIECACHEFEEYCEVGD